MTTAKPMPTLGVLGVYTGISLGPFSEVHEVMDHFYPGIFTLGTALMQPTAAKEVLRQVPEVADIPVPDNWKTADWQAYATAVIAKFGNTIVLSGPHGTGEPDMRETDVA